MTTRKELLILGIEKFKQYCKSNFPNTQLINDINKLDQYSIEYITLWISENICKPPIDQVCNTLILQSNLQNTNNLDIIKLKNFIIIKN